jgi:hypothetical protein
MGPERADERLERGCRRRGLRRVGDDPRARLDLAEIVAAPVAHREVLLDELERLVGHGSVEVLRGQLGELAADDLVDAHAVSSK